MGRLRWKQGTTEKSLITVQGKVRADQHEGGRKHSNDLSIF